MKAAFQPPSGGCVLKLLLGLSFESFAGQPPSGGCVLKQRQRRAAHSRPTQPPSGGCVLKPTISAVSIVRMSPAAFGRLCVETLA